MKLTFDEIEKRGLLIYKYIRGSQVYGTSLGDRSDIDEGGIYICPNDQLLDLGFDYQDEICDEKHDKCWWELGKFIRLILSSNPMVLEALYIPDDKVLYEHPIMTEIKKHRDDFITKQCFMPFGGYAVSQIKKARGQDKKIHWDIAKMVRKSPIDFCYTFNKQGSQPLMTFLSGHGLEQRNCGLVNVPNMPNVFGVYYDFGQHIILNGIDKEYFCDEANRDDKFISYVHDRFVDCWHHQEMTYEFNMGEVYDKIRKPKGGHCGIISENGDSNEIRYSSVSKNDKPICFMSYNVNGYGSHCKKYKEYETWKKNRNKARYENNLEGKEKENTSKFYDAKNMYHCFRLISMATEVARGEGLKIDRTDIDADFLLEVRTRKYTYDELMDKLTSMKAEMDDAISKSTIPESIDRTHLNNLLLNIRKQFNS